MIDVNIDNLWVILKHFNDDEVHHLEEEIDEELPEDLDEAIAMIERLSRTDHIAYNLLLLKSELQNE